MTDETDDQKAGEIPEQDVKMTIWEHLAEFRTRLVRSFVALILCSFVTYAYRKELLAWLIVPYRRAYIDRKLPGIVELQALAPGDAFVGYLQLSLVAAAVAASPIIFYQLWGFVAPGLYDREKRLIYPFVFFSTLLFLSGVAFAYYVGLPLMLNFFLSETGRVTDDQTVLILRPTFEYYTDLTTRTLLVFGVVFELPLFISFLVLGNIVTPKQLLRFSRWAIVLSFIVGAVATPGTEVTAQAALSGALIGLYFMSIAIAFFLRPSKKSTGVDDGKDEGKKAS